MCVTLAGPSGCGKSLLLRAIADLDPHQGEAFLDEEPQSETPAPSWRSRVGLLPAESHWWAIKVGDHIPSIQSETLEILGFSETCLTWDVARLSSGERQRLALARLLAGRPRILLLDEPSANLDQENTQRVERLIGSYLRETGAAVLWVSHDPSQRERMADSGFLIRNKQLEPELWK